jgi:hypothetical protein
MQQDGLYRRLYEMQFREEEVEEAEEELKREAGQLKEAGAGFHK